MEAVAGFKPSQAPSPTLAGKIPYEAAPPSVKRQKEAAAGLLPAQPQEEQQAAAQAAIEKHPDLPEKIAQQVAANQPNPAPVLPAQPTNVAGTDTSPPSIPPPPEKIP